MTDDEKRTALRWACPGVALGPGFSTHSVQRMQVIGFVAFAERCGMREYAMSLLREAMRENLKWWTLTQSEWRTKTSRRPQRGKHHDSWSIREGYARCDTNWSRR